MRTGRESAIDISNKVRDYVDAASGRFPEGIELFVWDDESKAIRGRLSTLGTSLLQGSFLVMLTLDRFCVPRSPFGSSSASQSPLREGSGSMPWFGITANVMSLFGFIIVVGVVVDDAIVTGENVYQKLRTGMDPTQAAIEGTQEVTLPVTFGVITTMVAFIPLMFFDGTWGDFAKQIPPVVAPVLLFFFLNPNGFCHRISSTFTTPATGIFMRTQQKVALGLEQFVDRIYGPSLAWALGHKTIVLSLLLALHCAWQVTAWEDI